MAAKKPEWQAPKPKKSVMQWLLDSDPSIRWQVMRDLTEEPDELVAAERSRVASDGWGARLLDLQGPDGTWGNGTSTPEWESTLYTLLLLRDLGLDPTSERARTAVGLVRDRVTWGPEFNDTPFFEGEVEPCINGGVLALGGYFGETSDRLLDRLLGEQLKDGGWNCDEVIDRNWTRFSFPTTWHYDVLRGLDYLRSAGVEPDERVDEVVGFVAKRRYQNGRWPLHAPHPDPVHFDMEGGAGKPSRWNTLRALRVLDWYAAQG